MIPMPEGMPSHQPTSEEIRAAGDLRELVWKLERRVDRQALVLQGLFALLVRSTKLSEQALLDEVRRLEQERQDAQPGSCARCGRVMGPRQMQCIYCGEARTVTSVFETL
jgi:hypothetical protein